jgi:type IV pilus assembly protein PilB
VDSLREGGNLVCLEGKAGPVPSMAMFVKRADKLERVRTLGWVDFNRNSSQILIDLGMVDERALAKAKAEAAVENCRVLDVLRRNMNVEEIDLYRSLAQQRGMVFVDADELLPSLKVELFRGFSRTFLDLSRIIPVAQESGKITFVTDDPDARTDQLERMSPNHTIECWLVTPTDFRRIWSALDLSAKGNRFAADQAVLSTAGSGGGGKRDNSLGGEAGSDHVSPYLVSVYEAILLDAVSEKASDVHIEQYNERVRIRLRVDGDLRDLSQYQLTPRELRGVINVIKLRAELNIAERRLPQGGRSRLQLGNMAYDLRIQTQPSLHGEHAVIRLLPQTGRAMTIAELGMSPMIGSHYERLLDNPAGLVLVVGPTG